MSFEDLPHLDKSRLQSNESERALGGIFCLPMFIARPQNPDIGIDFDVELADQGRGSNIHFSIQLKSVTQGDLDQTAHALRFRIETSCLHYLSRTLAGSLLVIYDASSKTMFYRWVHEAIPELDSRGVVWRNQDTVTIHFPLSNILDRTSAAEIGS